VITRAKSDIGFGKKIKGAWLDDSLRHVAAGRTFPEVNAELTEIIRLDNPGEEAIRKVLSCLNRIWFDPPSYCRATRDAAVAIYKRSNSATTRFLLNWGMAISAYPFVGSVAEAVGRLLKVQGVARISDIRRRVNEKFGDREFVQRIVRYDISSFLDWGALLENAVKGQYVAGPKVFIDDAAQVGWLTEALLHSTTGSLALTHLRQHPVLFPFQIDEIGAGLSVNSSRLQTLRHSHNAELVTLRSKEA
jgi:hypothetical protein